MIRVKLLEGPFSGKSKRVDEKISPEDFFQELFLSGWRWEVDYSQASTEEKYRWFRVDLASRCARTISMGLPVNFLGKTYQVDSKDSAGQALKLCQLEDAIVASGRMITIERDDDNGVVIGVRGYEQ